jgi:hypothetical protein
LDINGEFWAGGMITRRREKRGQNAALAAQKTAKNGAARHGKNGREKLRR